jgi:hypothetical protein
VVIYAVAGRQRSPAVSTFIKLLRASDWPAQISKVSFSRDEA